MNPNDTLKAILTTNGYSITKVRLQIFSALQQLEQPLPVSRLADRLAPLDRVSVYRTIDLFEKLGIVSRVWNGFKSTVELSDRFSPHHHHFTCRHCGKAEHFSDEKIEQLLRSAALAKGFVVSAHVIELSGLCKDCAKQTTAIA